MNLLGQYEHNILTSEVLNQLLDYVVIVIAHNSFKAIVWILLQHHRLIR